MGEVGLDASEYWNIDAKTVTVPHPTGRPVPILLVTEHHGLIDLIGVFVRLLASMIPLRSKRPYLP